MAQRDAMEQAKEVLRQIIKYRFWISIGVAALFALIAYFVGSGPVRDKAASETKKIKDAETLVKQYVSNTIPTKEYKPIVQEKTQILTKDVNSAWKTLFDRQAPLLTWPETVQERFRKWGRDWPKDTSPKTVELTIIDYMEAYPSYVSMVYKTFNPFDYESGEGILAAPPEAALLRPAQFSIEHPPDLGKVWAAQERLWIQRTLGEVVAQVNKNSKTWDTAVIRQVVELEVGNPVAQDQRSLAKNETLEEAPSIHAPGEETADAAAPAGGGGGGAIGDAMRGMGRGGMGMMGGGGGLGAGQGSENVYYVKAATDKGQYKIMPVLMTVLIDQDHVQDFLIELENSPMSIQVMDIELKRPSARVTKPEKGADAAIGGMGMMGDMSRMMQGSGQMGRMGGFGGMAGQMQNYMQNQMSQMQRQGMMGMGGAMGGGMGAEKKRQGKDVRNINREEAREKTAKAATEAKGPSLFDPYFEIVQVTVYGQARFFNPPPADAGAEPSPGQVEAAPAAGGTAGSPAGSAADKAAPAQSPAGTAAAPDQKSAAPKAGGDAASTPPQGGKDAKNAKPAPKTGGDPAPNRKDDAAAAKGGDNAAPDENDDAGPGKPATKDKTPKTQAQGPTSKP